MKLYFVRHGESTANRLREFSNSGLKHPLTGTGVEQAHAVARALAGLQVERIYSSPVLRAVQTAQILTEVLSSPIEITEALREWSVGIYEGTSDPVGWELHRQVQDLWFDEQQFDSRLPAGESFRDIQNRFKPFIDSLVSNSSDRNIVLVAHGGLYLAMLPTIFKNIDFSFARQHGFPNAAYAVAETRSDELYCLSWCGAPPDTGVNYKEIVQRGYDRCAAAYAEARQSEATPELDLLTNRLTAGARVLDIGCGAGLPVARTLAQHFQVTGVDISGEQIRRAQINVPAGRFIHGDILSIDFPTASFDAVVAFYSIFHLPREEQPELLRRIKTWLKPGSYLLATVTSLAEAGYLEDDFFGVTMYWSNLGLKDYQDILTRLGFRLLETAMLGHGYAAEKQTPAEHHPLIFAQIS